MFSAIVLLVVLSCGLGEEFSNPEVDFGSRVLALIGRSTSTIERHPYAVQVLRADRIVCAGTLISQRHVLTSAHCFYNENGSLLNARDFTIRTGNSTVSSRSRKGTGGGSSGGSGGSGSGGSGSGGSGSGGSGSGSGGWCLFRCGSNNNNNNNGNGNSNNQQGNPIQYVTRIIVHERYAQTRPDNDIAVALMAAAVTLSGSTRAATLPHAGHAVPDNMTLLHVGWDTTLAALNMTRPRELPAPKLSRAECEQRYSELGALSGDPQHITDNMLCSGQPDSGGVSCADDSGGPVVSGGVVVGVAWWGYGCARAQHPAVSARVAQYAEWINDTMSRNSVAGPASPALGKLMVLTIVATTIFNRLFLK